MKKKILIYVGIVLAFLALSYAYVPQVLSGKVVNQSDISGWQGAAQEANAWNAAHPDDKTAWSESMFGGMPVISYTTNKKGDLTQVIYDALLYGKRPATYFFVSLLGAFLLLLSLGVNPLVAAGGAVAVTFCSYNLQIIQVGHNTKMQALAFLPWVLAALIFTYRSALEKKKWLPLTALGAALFALALSFQIKANHPQVSYYLALVILIYVIVLIVSVLKDKEARAARFKRFAVASSLLLVLGLCGIATNATKLLPIKEYTPYSMRGGSSGKSDGDKASKGLDLEYATAWSYGWEELPNLMIPNYNGGSSAGALGKNSETYQLLRKSGYNNPSEVCSALPLYWGPQPFTAGPMYMGIITIFLFIMGLCYFKGRDKWWIVAATILAVLMALGNHFMIFTRFMFSFAPLYNKFRTVSMSLTVLQFTLPVLACLMLDKIIRSNEAPAVLSRQILTSAAITAGLCLVLAGLQAMSGSFESSADAQLPEQLAYSLASDRTSLLWADTLRSILFVAAAALLLIWGVTAPKTAPRTFATQPSMAQARRLTSAGLLCLLVLCDLFTVGRRFLSDKDFVTPRNFSSQFNQRPADKQILQDKDPSYRVVDYTVDIFNSSRPSYWHKNIGGYSPAKLQRYQEFIESCLASELNALRSSLSKLKTVADAENLPYLKGLASMNCRYVIVSDELALTYPHARGNAWFRNPQHGTIELESYAPNCLKYKSYALSADKVIFSEVYYPVGWTLILDGKEEIPIELYEGDMATPGNLLRCANVPKGVHDLEMRFDPPAYHKGEAVSMASSAILLLVVLLSAAGAIVMGKKKEED